ncbi:hypothetical protein SAMN04515667_1960 [Formosa sp. Hel1_31_208]|uniref:hypothetical protein n=1 Tax=Formosa sp. Hel1_31_208 TaxID=1798225 RepID=UPI00087A4D7A|nr:hypothetical protein [Formosa sp. Hel1_31_208]SDS34274.1 hypothetical protein SAMN04515667_1960 [Formosa sp. Hel1_31_208]
MKTKPTLIIVIFFLMVSYGFAQKKNDPVNIISGKVNISKYHNHNELNKMTKGELLVLYSERIEVIVNILPNIAFATKPGITMASLGIPETKDNKKALEENREASVDYFDSTVAFQKKILPYSDTRDLIAAILFYEETLKSLHTYNDFKTD